jgi:hypothetical protein
MDIVEQVAMTKGARRMCRPTDALYRRTDTVYNYAMRLCHNIGGVIARVLH